MQRFEMDICSPITDSLLAWYADHRRDLPWRRTTDPYGIWVSEIMLQQTQVATMLPYYERFLARFPTIESLAGAELDEVLALWQGLGYYARGRNLHAAARRIVQEHGGQVPRTRRELLALPGIGDYTAGAILSIAYGQDEPAVEANIARVLARLFDYDQDPTTSVAKRTFQQQARALLPSGRARDFLQAMMDLGALVCTSRSPRCGECPLERHCLAKARDVQEQRPLPKTRPPRPHRVLALGFCLRENRLLIVRRVPRGLLGGLWELPGCQVPMEGAPEQAAGGDARILDLRASGVCQGRRAPSEGALEQGLAACFRTHLGLTLVTAVPRVTVDHGYSHFELTAHVYDCALEGDPLPSGPWDDARWLSSQELAEYGLTGLTGKALTALSWPDEPQP
ncbi:MAG: A/G-specific adenine glycosylase [Chloroflexi bacterium]|nr:A/G-specific adenine glycosylase [Chloroflexota bacterium]